MLDFFRELYVYLKGNIVALTFIVTTLFTLAEAIVRLTPTEKDDGAVERVGKVLRKIADFLKIPNVKKKPNTVITPEGQHSPKQD